MSQHRSTQPRPVARAAAGAIAAGAVLAGGAVALAPQASAQGAQPDPAPTADPAPGQPTLGLGKVVAPRPAHRAPVFLRVSATGLGTLPKRSFDPTLVYPCNRVAQVWINDQLRTVADFGGGVRIEGVEMTKALRAGGFTWDEMTTALAVAVAESDRCPKAFHNNLDPVTGQIRSVDRGLWQINLKYHPKYASWDLNDPALASKAAKEIQSASGWGPWAGYVNRERFMGWAEQAVIDAKAAGVK